MTLVHWLPWRKGAAMLRPAPDGTSATRYAKDTHSGFHSHARPLPPTGARTSRHGISAKDGLKEIRTNKHKQIATLNGHPASSSSLHWAPRVMHLLISSCSPPSFIYFFFSLHHSLFLLFFLSPLSQTRAHAHTHVHTHSLTHSHTFPPHN